MLYTSYWYKWWLYFCRRTVQDETNNLTKETSESIKQYQNSDNEYLSETEKVVFYSLFWTPFIMSVGKVLILDVDYLLSYMLTAFNRICWLPLIIDVDCLLSYMLTAFNRRCWLPLIIVVDCL